MQNANTNRNVEKASSIRLGQHPSWSIPTFSTPSAPLSLIPPPHNLTIVIVLQLQKQANVGSDHQSFVAPARSQLDIVSFVAGYFVCRKWNIFISQFIALGFLIRTYAFPLRVPLIRGIEGLKTLK